MNKTFIKMKLYTMAFNDEKELADFVNEKGIEKKNIVNVFQTSFKDYMLVYYGE